MRFLKSSVVRKKDIDSIWAIVLKHTVTQIFNLQSNGLFCDPERCLLFHFPSLKSQRSLMFSFKVLFYVTTCKMVLEEKLFHVEQKKQKQQSVAIKRFCSDTLYCCEYKKIP